MKNDEFGDRMKQYENAFNFSVEKQYKAEFPYYPYMRLDGRSFSKFTKSLCHQNWIQKPRDLDFENVLVSATKDVVKEFSLKLGFHQSDEISLFFKPVEDEITQIPFNGKLQKLVSVIPSYFTARFCYYFNEIYNFVPNVSFDGRICVFPSSCEATNMLVWRYQDASRNLIQDIAHYKFSDKQLFKKSTQEKFEMIGSPKLKPGNFIKRVTYEIDVWGKPEYKDHNFDGVEKVTRSKIDHLHDVDFQNMNFGERKNLIYGEL